MGNSCTLPKKSKIAVPSKVVYIHQKELLVQRAQNVTNTGVSSLKSLSKVESSPLISAKPSNSEIQTTTDLDEDLRLHPTYKSLITKYDICELGIGEYFLGKVYEQAKSTRNTKAKNLQTSNEVLWDRRIVQMRPKVSDFPNETSLFSHVDLCMKEFACDKPKVFAKLLREGPPMRYRWSVWKNLLNPDRFYVKDLYERFKGLSSPYEEQIRRDISRTFPNEPYFASKKYDQIGQEQLFDLLKAVSLYFPNVGYLQGMNFLMGFLLLVNGGNELDAFWAFVTLVRDHKYMMMGFFEKDFPLLDFYLYIFYHTLEEELPLVYKHLKQQQIPDQLWVFKWFLTVFLYSVPELQVVRIWDFMLNAGMFGVIQIAVAILKYFGKELLELDTFGMDQFLRHLRGESLGKKGQGNKSSSHINGTQSNMNGNQSMMNSQAQYTPKAIGQNTINLNNLDFESCSIFIETSDFQYSFKEVDIEEVLKIADTVLLPLEKIVFLAQGYSESTSKELPEFYHKYLTRFDTFYGYDSLEKQAKFQRELDFYIMKSELSEKPSDEIVVSNLLNENENENNDILLNLNL